MKGFWQGVAVGSLCAVGMAMYFALAPRRREGMGTVVAAIRRPAWGAGRRGRTRVLGRVVGG
jgi:hypothetical protein